MDNSYLIDNIDIIEEDLKNLTKEYISRSRGPSKFEIYSREMLKLNMKLMKTLQYSHKFYHSAIL